MGVTFWKHRGFLDRLYLWLKQSILFIDDSDMLFESRDIQSAGLYRYLLTLLDGLQSEAAGRVCVMMTVMDVAALPPALVRSCSRARSAPLGHQPADVKITGAAAGLKIKWREDDGFPTRPARPGTSVSRSPEPAEVGP